MNKPLLIFAVAVVAFLADDLINFALHSLKNLTIGIFYDDTESSPFQRGQQLLEAAEYDGALEAFEESWKAWNATQEKGGYHFVALVNILDGIQMSAGKTGNLTYALKICFLMLENEHFQVSEEESYALARNVHLYKQKMVAQAHKEVADTEGGTEMDFWEQGYQFMKKEQWSEAYVNVKESLRLYNKATDLGLPHIIPEIQILDVLQYLAFQTKRYEEGFDVCYRIINELELSGDLLMQYQTTLDGCRRNLANNPHYRPKKLKTVDSQEEFDEF